MLGDPGGSEAFHEKVVKGVSLRDENAVRAYTRRVCDFFVVVELLGEVEWRSGHGPSRAGFGQ